MSAHLREEWAALVTGKKKPVAVPHPTNQMGLLAHIGNWHGYGFGVMQELRNTKAAVIRQAHIDMHRKNLPGTRGHTHPTMPKDTEWAEDPKRPGRALNGGYYHDPAPGQDQ